MNLERVTFKYRPCFYYINKEPLGLLIAKNMVVSSCRLVSKPISTLKDGLEIFIGDHLIDPRCLAFIVYPHGPKPDYFESIHCLDSRGKILFSEKFITGREEEIVEMINHRFEEYQKTLGDNKISEKMPCLEYIVPKVFRKQIIFVEKKIKKNVPKKAETNSKGMPKKRIIRPPTKKY
jgi:hypothetical protein